MHFHEWKFLYFDSSFIEFCTLGSNWCKVSIGSGNGLARNRQKNIIWTNVDPVHRRIYAALGGEELTQNYKSTFLSPTNFCIFDFNFVCMDRIYRKSTLFLQQSFFLTMAHSQAGDKPLPRPLIIQLKYISCLQHVNQDFVYYFLSIMNFFSIQFPVLEIWIVWSSLF